MGSGNVSTEKKFVFDYIDRNAGAIGGDSRRARVQANFDPLEFQNILDGLCNIGILSKYELSSPLDDGDPRAESSEDLTEFECDVTPSQDDQVLRHLGQLEESAVIQPWNGVQPWNFGNARACSGIDIDSICLDDIVTHTNLPWTLETSPLLDERYAFCRGDPRNHPGIVANGVHARPNSFEVYLDPIWLNAVLRCAPHHVGDLRAGHEGLGRGATRVHTGAAYSISFNDGDRVSGRQEGAQEGARRLAGPEYRVFEMTHSWDSGVVGS